MKQRSQCSHMKLRSASQTLKRKLEEEYGVSIHSDEFEEQATKRKLKDLKLYEDMMKQLKEKFKEPTTSYAHKLQILTLSPFTQKRTMEEFGATHHMIKRSRRLKDFCGILGLPDKKKGKKLSEEMKKIRDFYEQDDVSRMCPRKRDYKSVCPKDGSKIQHQKRLLLSNFKKLYQKWKQENTSLNIGFSTFAALRPHRCIVAGEHGTHSVCVCMHHQNSNLMVASLHSNIKYSDLMEKIVCSVESEQCMMGRCKNCPGEESLVTFLHSLEECQVLEEIEYKQWMSTNNFVTLVTIKEQTSDFIDNLSNKIVSLTRHHYMAKAQSAYMKILKETMNPEKECIILGDFSENYSFIVQDAAQGFHWENSQATLHPFVAYYRTSDDRSTEHTNMCIISDSGKHSTAAVHVFQKLVLSHLQTTLTTLQKVHYFSDGCAAQYKNRYNFINLCNHQQDFNMDCEWNFFATSHGKSTCDGIGGTVKRLTAKASLQRPIDKQILTPLDMFNFCEESIQGKYITFYIVFAKRNIFKHLDSK